MGIVATASLIALKAHAGAPRLVGPMGSFTKTFLKLVFKVYFTSLKGSFHSSISISVIENLIQLGSILAKPISMPYNRNLFSCEIDEDYEKCPHIIKLLLAY